MTVSDSETSGEVSQKRGRPRGSRRPPMRYPEVDRYVSTALSLRNIALRCDSLKSRRAVWQYYNRTDQLEIRRRDNPLCKQEISQLIGSIINEAQQQISYAVWLAQVLAYIRASDAEKKVFEKASEYFQSKLRSRYDWGELEIALTRRFAAEEAGEKKSLGQLTEGLEISPIGLSRVFCSVNVEPMYKTPTRPRYRGVK